MNAAFFFGANILALATVLGVYVEKNTSTLTWRHAGWTAGDAATLITSFIGCTRVVATATVFGIGL